MDLDADLKHFTTRSGWWPDKSGIATCLIAAGLLWGCASHSLPTASNEAPLFPTFESGDRLACCGLALPGDGAVVLVGRADTISGRSWAWAAKVAPNGLVAWEREWSSAHHFVGFYSATEIADDAVMAVGDGEGRAGIIARIDPNGALDWVRTLQVGDHTRLRSIVSDGENGALIAGALGASTQPWSLFVAKVTTSGDIARHSIIGQGDDIVAMRRIYPEGYVVISSQWELVRLDRHGDVRWRQRLDGAMDAVGLSDGSLVVLTYPEAGASRPRLVRLDAAGMKIWKRHLSEATGCSPGGIFLRQPDHIVVITDPCDDSKHLAMVSFSAGGEERSVRQLQVHVGVFAAHVRADASDGVVATGMFRQDLPEAKKGWLFRSGATPRPRP